MLDSIYHMTSKLLKNVFWPENINILPSFTQLYNGHHHSTLLFKICKPLVVYRFYCMALYHSQTRLHVINFINPKLLDR